MARVIASSAEAQVLGVVTAVLSLALQGGCSHSLGWAQSPSSHASQQFTHQSHSSVQQILQGKGEQKYFSGSSVRPMARCIRGRCPTVITSLSTFSPTRAMVAASCLVHSLSIVAALGMENSPSSSGPTCVIRNSPNSWLAYSQPSHRDCQDILKPWIHRQLGSENPKCR